MGMDLSTQIKHLSWANDGNPSIFVMNDELNTTIRAAWEEPGTDSAKDMYNEGGRPFLFPGKIKGYENVVPDFDKINPQYFKYMDRKVDYLNDNGIIPFIEVARRDVSEVWKNYYDWPESYARYIQYVFCRYQANNCLLSPIHYDWYENSISSREYNIPANLVIERYGYPPFGNMISANPSPSTLINFGGVQEAKWIKFHQIGNWREHHNYWFLTEIYNNSPAMPAINGEPYYPGYPDNNPPADSWEAELNCRSAIYGSFLSGALGGYIYGVEGIWGGDISEKAMYRLWDVINLKSAQQAVYLKNFAMIEGSRYVDLIPNNELVVPNKSDGPMSYRGWAYCACTKDKDLLLAYFEKGCPKSMIRGLKLEQKYQIKWFNPIIGQWINSDNILILKSNARGILELPDFPAEHDWGICIKLSQ